MPKQYLSRCREPVPMHRFHYSEWSRKAGKLLHNHAAGLRTTRTLRETETAMRHAGRFAKDTRPHRVCLRCSRYSVAMRECQRNRSCIVRATDTACRG